MRVSLSNLENQCLSFFWPQQPDYSVGYRFLEHRAETRLQPFDGLADQPRVDWGDLPDLSKLQPAAELEGQDWLPQYKELDGGDAVQLHFQAYGGGSAYCRFLQPGGLQQCELFLRPAMDGVQMWMRLHTQEPLPGSYAVQQCLRLTGSYNQAWRRSVAHLPLLSEFDMQAMGRPNASLTWARRNERWLNFPVQYTQWPTQAGALRLPECQALDHGLIVRESAHRDEAPDYYWQHAAAGTQWRQVSAGLYWERSLAVSNRHPADCLHALVDFGPLPAGQARTLHGKVYFIEGTKDDLLAHWTQDFD